MARNDLQALLTKGAELLGLKLSQSQADSCLIYFDELRKWNQKINLTAIRDERDIIVKHYLDSLSYRTGFTPSPGTLLLDMGSGAGFPALPLRIAFPGIRVTLVESTQKKAAFLRHIIRTLDLSGTEVRVQRVGDLSVSMDRSFDVVTARAFASMGSALTEGSRFLRPHGVMVLSRGPEEKIDSEVLDDVGMMVISRAEIVLPLSDHRRTLWVFGRKT